MTVIGALTGIIGLIALWDSPWHPTAMVLPASAALLFLLIETYNGRVLVIFSGCAVFITRSRWGRRRTSRQIETDYGYWRVSSAAV